MPQGSVSHLFGIASADPLLIGSALRKPDWDVDRDKVRDGLPLKELGDRVDDETADAAGITVPGRYDPAVIAAISSSQEGRLIPRHGDQ